jgi:hypothetical protein
MQAVDAIVVLIPMSSILLEESTTIIANLDQQKLDEISIVLDDLGVDGKYRDFFLTAAVNTKRGFYLDAWIPTLQSF